MYAVKVKIVKIIDAGYQPGIVAFELIDVNGIKHDFVEKLPYVYDGNIFDLKLPEIGYMRCSIFRKNESTAVINTEIPDDVESTEGKRRFEVDRDAIVLI